MKFIEHTAARRLKQQRIAKKRLKAEEFASEVEAAIISVFVYGILIAALMVIAKYSYDAWCDEEHKIIIKETLSEWQATILVYNRDLLLVCILVLTLSIYAVLKRPK
jgi:hypothetical protein